MTTFPLDLELPAAPTEAYVVAQTRTVKLSRMVGGGWSVIKGGAVVSHYPDDFLQAWSAYCDQTGFRSPIG